MKGLQTVLENNPAIKKAAELQRQFTADDLLMEQYEARQKYLHDIATIKGIAYDEGLEKGEKIVQCVSDTVYPVKPRQSRAIDHRTPYML